MKQIFLLLILSLISFSVSAQSKKSKDLVSVIVSGSGCPQKTKKPLDLKIVSDVVQIPLDFEIALPGPGLVRKVCQARLTLKATPGFQYEIREVSQNLLFNLQKKSLMHAELSFGIIGQHDFKIDQDVNEAGEYRHILVKKMINYASPCGKDAILRLQNEVRASGVGRHSLKAEPLVLTLQKRECSDPVQ